MFEIECKMDDCIYNLGGKCHKDDLSLSDTIGASKDLRDMREYNNFLCSAYEPNEKEVHNDKGHRVRP